MGRALGIRAMADLATPMSLRVGATLGVADHVEAGATDAVAVAARCGAHAESLERLLLHWEWLGLLGRDSYGGYFLTEVGAQLRSDHPSSRRPWLDMSTGIGRGDLAFVELLHTMTTGRSAYEARYGSGFWDDLDAVPELRTSFDALMRHHVELDAARIVETYPWGQHATIVDVGGGDGTLLARLLSTWPDLHGVLIELEQPAAAARATLAAAGVADRARVATGSFLDSVPDDGDAYILSTVLHDWDDEGAGLILRRCREAMSPADRLLVVEAVGADGESTDPRMDLRMLAYMGGRERGVAALAALAAVSDLVLEGVHPVPDRDYMAVLEFRSADEG